MQPPDENDELASEQQTRRFLPAAIAIGGILASLFVYTSVSPTWLSQKTSCHVHQNEAGELV